MVRMKRYYTYTVKKLVTVQHLVTIEYLPIDAQFTFPEENHDFYEFVYIESGQILCHTNEDTIHLGENDLFLISPDTPHAYCAEEGQSAVILIVCFKSKSNMISLVNGKHDLNEDTSQLVKNILTEAKATFAFPFDEKLTLSDLPRLGSQQLIENYIEEMLIKLIQSVTYKQQDIRIAADTTDIRYSIAEEIKKILAGSLYTRISLEDISHSLLYSKTYLNDVFKEHTGNTIMRYYQELKLREAKRLLRNRESIAEIAEKLCFESPQYFAKAFKKHTGMTPSEYKKAAAGRSRTAV